VKKARADLGQEDTNTAELAAFTSYAQGFPAGFLALVDTYDTLKSGVPNFLAVALALDQLGYKAVGIRLDSGDLAELSKATRRMFIEVGQKFNKPWMKEMRIVASDDINEWKLHRFNQVGHEMDVFGVGTHLVTCQAQPSLGGVYKLVEVDTKSRIKISGEFAKMTIPGKKDVYRLYGKDGKPIADFMTRGQGDVVPKAGEKLTVFLPFDDKVRYHVTPHRVENLYKLYFDGKVVLKPDPIDVARERAIKGYTEDFSEYAKADEKSTKHFPLFASEGLAGNLRRLFLENAVVPKL